MPIDIEGMHWLNTPPMWEVNQGRLFVQSGNKTDFWQETYYGFHRDDGHFLERPAGAILPPKSPSSGIIASFTIRPA